MKKSKKLILALAITAVATSGLSKNTSPLNKISLTESVASESKNYILSSSSSGYTCTIIFNGSDFVNAIKSIKVNGTAYKETTKPFIDNEEYFLVKGSDGPNYSVRLSKLRKGDNVEISTDKEKLTFTILKPDAFFGDIHDPKSVKVESLRSKPESRPETPSEPEHQPSQAILNPTYSVSIIGYGTLSLGENTSTDKLTSLAINGRSLKKTSRRSQIKHGDSYYINTDNISINTLNNNDIIKIGYEGREYEYVFKDGAFSLKTSKKEDPSTPPSPSHPESPTEHEEEINPTYKEGTGENILDLGKGTDPSKLESISINKVKLNKMERMISVFENSYAIEDGKIYIVRINNNDSVSIVYKGKTYNYIYKKDENKFEKAEENVHANYKIRLTGEFDNLLVNQKKIDGSSGGSFSVSSNPNKVGVEYTDKENPTDKDWKTLETKGNEFDSVEALIDDPDTGVTPTFAYGSINLGSDLVPKKAGTFKIKLKAVDKRGKEILSNPVDLLIYKGDENLEDILQTKNFVQVKDGKYLWDMSPWRIENFNDKNEVTVPAGLKAWFGSHKSSVYGDLGKETFGEPTQTLIVGKDTNLTFKNMRILGSVKIVVKDGGILNLDDSVVYGNIEVSNGGKLNVNYSPYNNKFTTGASISGQIILKDGAILGHSSIYSNTNYASQGHLMNTSEKPLIKVEGKAKIEGDVFVRGDEAATAHQAQPAMEIVSPGEVDIAQGSSLNLYGGGYKPLTSLGGEALILKGGKVTGAGKLVAVGGNGLALGNPKTVKGGAGVSGEGEISVAKAYLKGGNSSTASVGKAIDDPEKVKVSKNTAGVGKDGKVQTTFSGDDFLADYWTGTNATKASVKEKADQAIATSPNKFTLNGKTDPPHVEPKPEPHVEPKPEPHVEPKPAPRVNPSSKVSDKLQNKQSYPHPYSLYGLSLDKEDTKKENLDLEKLKSSLYLNRIQNQAAKLLLKYAPKQVESFKDKLESLVKKSEAFIKKAEDILKKHDDKKEDDKLEKAIMNNEISSKACRFLLDNSPKMSEDFKENLQKLIHDSKNIVDRAKKL